MLLVINNVRPNPSSPFVLVSQRKSRWNKPEVCTKTAHCRITENGLQLLFTLLLSVSSSVSPSWKLLSLSDSKGLGQEKPHLATYSARTSSSWTVAPGALVVLWRTHWGRQKAMEKVQPEGGRVPRRIWGPTDISVSCGLQIPADSKQSLLHLRY